MVGARKCVIGKFQKNFKVPLFALLKTESERFVRCFVTFCIGNFIYDSVDCCRFGFINSSCHPFSPRHISSFSSYIIPHTQCTRGRCYLAFKGKITSMGPFIGVETDWRGSLVRHQYCFWCRWCHPSRLSIRCLYRYATLDGCDGAGKYQQFEQNAVG